MSEIESMRLDKWLKVARLYKQRTKAETAIESGEVKVNGERVKPSKQVRVGDVLTVKRGHFYRDFTVKGLSTKSVSVALARELYEAEEPKKPKGKLAEYFDIFVDQERLNRKERKKHGKPNKKERRTLNKQKYMEDL